MARDATKKERKERAVLGDDLSFRERQVVRLVAEGHSNKIIAFTLYLSEGTVKEYLHRIFQKVGVGNRTQLAVWAVAHLEAVAAA